jgi:hypothetical protein
MTHRHDRTWPRDCARRVLPGLLAIALTVPLPLLAQAPGPGGSLGPEELEQIAAPIALYPDAVLAQALMAATYPLEVVMAARFAQANPGLTAEALNEALTAQNWDDSVKSLVVVPQILSMMNEQLAWTQKLGDAFLAQREELMDAIQRLRARAQAEGTLATTPQQVVTVEPAPAEGPPVIGIEPAEPGVVYVPTYDPLVVYGPWPYPAYPPYYYYPPGWIVGGFFSFGVGIVVGAALWGRCDWHHRRLDLDVGRYQRFTRVVNVDRDRSELIRGRLIPGGERLSWEHSPEHRRGVLYRTEGLQRVFGRPVAPDPAAREIFRGREETAGRQGPGRAPGAEIRPGPQPGRAPGADVRPGSTPRPERGPGAPAPGRPIVPGVTPREPGAFQGLGRGPDTRTYSERGRESRRSLAPPPRPAPPSSSRPAPSRPAPSRPGPSGPSHGAAPRGGGHR